MRLSLPQQPATISALVIAALSCAVVIAAQLFEHVGGFRPCELCLLERKSWYFAVPAALLTLYALYIGRIGPARLLLALLTLVFVWNTALSAYHVGVEWHWWEGPTNCTGSANLSRSIDELIGGRIEPIVRCDEAQSPFLGISFAAYDFMTSLFAALVAWFGACNRTRREPAARA